MSAQTPHGFRQEIRRAKSILEAITGRQVIRFRTPSFGITLDTPWALPIIAEEGFLYDSGVLPVMHDSTGIPRSNQWAHLLSCGERKLWEIAPSTANWGGFRVPIVGGAYLRALNYPTTKSLLARIESLDEPIVMYLQPWEIRATHPLRKGSTLAERSRYIDLGEIQSWLTQLLTDFRSGPVCEAFTRIRQLRRSLHREVAPGVMT